MAAKIALAPIVHSKGKTHKLDNLRILGLRDIEVPKLHIFERGKVRIHRNMGRLH